jgi:two-component system LytT family sensor kinase
MPHQKVRIPARVLWAIATLFALLAAASSTLFTRLTGVSLWSLQADATAVWPYIVLMNAVYWYSWAVLVGPVLAFGAHGPSIRGGWPAVVAAHCVAGAAAVFAHALLAGSGRWLLQQAFGVHAAWWDGVLLQFLRTFDWGFGFYAGLVGFAHALRYRADAEARAVEAAELQTELVEAQLLSLQRQLHPHFLFNTLHAISALVRRDPERAEAMIEKLGDLLRVTLGRVGFQKVPLREELVYLDTYLDIERIHFGERLKIVRNVASDVLDAEVPFLILQPLVENAIKHGLSPRRAGGTVSISASLQESHLVLSVSDDGVGIRAGAVETGVGLTNTRVRLERLYGADHRFILRAPEGGGVHVEIHLPWRPVPQSRHTTLAEVLA